MHPILAHNRRLGLYLFVFLQAGVLLAELLVRTAGVPRPQALLLAVPLLLIHSFSCLASWYVCRSVPLGADRPERWVVTQLAAAVLACGVLIAIGALWSRILDRSGRFEGTGACYREATGMIFVFALLLFSLAVAVHYLFIAYQASRAAESRAFELKLLAREAELKALKAQIDPHFLFNSLNSISSLVSADPEQARQMCIALAGFLRQSLRTGELDSLPLADELALVESYLAVERVRFGDRLRVEWSVAEDCRGCMVPPLILQPLAENAVRHGIVHLLAGGTVIFGAGIDAGRLHLTVENPCDPDRPAASDEGIGLTNVRQRLAAELGREATLDAAASHDRFVVRAVMPVRRQEISRSDVRTAPVAENGRGPITRPSASETGSSGGSRLNGAAPGVAESAGGARPE